MASVFPAIFLTTMVSIWLSQGEAVQSGANLMMLGSSSVALYLCLHCNLSGLWGGTSAPGSVHPTGLCSRVDLVGACNNKTKRSRSLIQRMVYWLFQQILSILIHVSTLTTFILVTPTAKNCPLVLEPNRLQMRH